MARKRKASKKNQRREHEPRARTHKKLKGKKPGAPKTHQRPKDKNNLVYGLAEQHGRAWRLRAITRKDNNIYTIVNAKDFPLAEGDILRCTATGDAKARNQNLIVLAKIGHQDDPGIFHVLATLSLELPHEFSDAAMREAREGKVPPLGNRRDLRTTPLVTIDDIDAKDFDDAVYAEKTDAGWRLIVAIADVANYVLAGSPLDKEAFLRGNSVYFPGHVIPMLPEQLSNNMCSLRPLEDRAALCCEMQLDKNGNVKSWEFYRALIKSAARLTYRQVQDAIDGRTDETTAPILENVIQPLHQCFQSLLKARIARGTLDLDLPEYKVMFDDSGHAVDIHKRMRLDSHKLIEEMMIAANVCAARELNKRNSPALYRVHEAPDPVKLEFARDLLHSMGFKLVKGAPQPRDFMQILNQAKDHPEAPLINQTVLRTQSQAVYSPVHAGHFGLALTHYTHFTSPIRRYSDLIVHRALINSLKIDRAEVPTIGVLEEIANHINVTERRAIEAERQVMDRYRAMMLAGMEGQIFTVRINGISRFGAFVTMDQTGADGIIPMRNLGRDYLIWQEGKPYLANRGGKAVYRLGQIINAKLLEVSPISGGLVFEVVNKAEDSPAKPLHARGASLKSGQRKFRRPKK